jgi:ABC-2 type transport system permease protein
LRNVLILARKETYTYYASPMAYVVSAVFLALAGHFLVRGLSTTVPEASVREMLTPLAFAVILWAPVTTMRLLAEEQKMGTLELLMTTPIREWEIVLGKFVALLMMFLGIVVPTFIYVGLLALYGSPDPGPLFSGYLGLMLYGGAAASLGLFTSSLSGNQIIAGATSAVALLFLTLADQAAEVVAGPPATILRSLSLPGHYNDFIAGVVELSDLVYFVTFIGIFLLLATLSLETRRWR